MVADPEQTFKRHAYPHIRASRRYWTEKERKVTIPIVYYAEPAIRQHYANSDAANPALLALFPQHPYIDRDDIIVARSHECYPDQVPDVPYLQWVRASGRLVRHYGTQTTSTGPLPQAAAAPAQTQTAGAPYEFWPALPWEDEPNLPDITTIGATSMTVAKQDDLLQTKPYFLDDETRWHGAKFLGHGSYGAVGLWCKVDEHWNIVDRMVVKDHAAMSRNNWRDPNNWRDRLPREVAIHQRIESRRAAEPEAFEYIVKCRGHRLLTSKRRFRLYLDFASGGSIGPTVEKYDKRWNDIASDKIDTEKCLPEAFIWYTIKALATACLALENSTLGNDPVGDWKPIMHLDFQTPNILLDVQSKKRKHADDSTADPPNTSEPSEPGPRAKKPTTGRVYAKALHSTLTPKLADFGLATFDLDFSHCPALDDNPSAHILPANAHNTRYAPEHHYLSGSDPVRLDAKTDIWGLGRIAWALIVNMCESDGPLREDGVHDVFNRVLTLSTNQDENWPPRDAYDEAVLVGVMFPAAKRYSEELKALVRRCLKFDKEDRPSAREVLGRADVWLVARPLEAERAESAEGSKLVLPEHRGFEVGELLMRTL